MKINPDTFCSPCFPISNRLKRLLWNLFAASIFRFIPTPLHELRSIALRLFGARIGRGVHVYPKAIIWAPWNLILGDEVGIANGVILYNQGLIKIGTRSVISQGAHLCAGTHDYEISGMPLIIRPISIGDFVWITADVFIHPGLTIPDGVVIGARSVVTSDMPAWSVCSGHPCKPLKLRKWRPVL